MKKIIALVVALVLSLGLATVAFADDYIGGQLRNELRDEESSYHAVPGIITGDTFSFWACFDGEVQSGLWLIEDGLIAMHNSKTGVDSAINFGVFSFDKEIAAATDTDLAKAANSVKTLVKINTNAQYVDSLTVLLHAAWFVEDADAKLVPATFPVAAGTELFLFADGLYVEITPIDFVIAENRTVTASVYIYDNNALTTSWAFTCNIAVELRNHYIDTECLKADGSYVWNNASLNAAGFQYTPAHNDLQNVINAGKALILNRHYFGTNNSYEPSYVIYTEQFAKVAKVLTPVTLSYAGIVDVKIADPKIQTGINFKYAQAYDLTDAMTYLNPTADVYEFQFLSKELLDSKAEITLYGVAAALGYINEKEQPAFLYYSADGTVGSYTFIEKVDLKAGNPVYKIDAGNVLGYLLVSNEELKFAAAEDGKENVGTGASAMVSTCVALAVVSLVAAGAVCIKKVSK